MNDRLLVPLALLRGFATYYPIQAVVIALGSVAWVMGWGNFAPPPPPPRPHICETVADLAETIMAARQADLSLQQVLEEVRTSPEAEVAKQKLNLIVLAYLEPIRPASAARDEAIRAFGRKMGMECRFG